MEMLILLFKSGLPREEVEKASESRADRYRQVKGLVQKFYVQEEATGRYGGVFVFDSKESLVAFRESELAKSTAQVYKFVEPPQMIPLSIAKRLFVHGRHS
jgi:hypothetical protein